MLRLTSFCAATRATIITNYLDSSTQARNRFLSLLKMFENASATKTTPTASTAKLSVSERQAYGRIGEAMSFYHNHFKSTWNSLYNACENNRRPVGTSIKHFLETASQFVHHLEIHHSIEEQHIFPILAQRMPPFKEEMELLSQHKEIHAGMEKLEAYIDDCKNSRRDLRLDQMKNIMDSFGTILWTHLNEEVENLSPENMQKYWTIEEVRNFPM